MKRKIVTPIGHRPCAVWAKKLNALHSDDLSLEERQALRQHLEGCSHCQNLHAEYRTIDALITGLPPVKPLPEMPISLQEHVNITQDARQWLHRKETPSVTPVSASRPPHGLSSFAKKLNAAAAVLVILALLGSFWLLLRTHQPNVGALRTDTPLYVVTIGQNTPTLAVLSALSPNTGQTIWQQDLDNTHFGDGLAVPGALYLPFEDGNVVAFRASDGQRLWQTSMSYPSSSGFINVWLASFNNIVLDSTTYGDNADSDLYALNAQTGAIVWHTHVQSHFQCQTPPAGECLANGLSTFFAQGVIYGLANDGLSAWDATNGRFLWRNPDYPLNGQPQSMVVAQHKIYIIGSDMQMNVLDAHTGHFLHRVALPQQLNSGEFTPIYDLTTDGKIIYILGSSSAFAYRTSDDALLWTQSFDNHVEGTIGADGNNVYVNYTDVFLGKNDPPLTFFYTLRASDGQLRWQHIWKGPNPMGFVLNAPNSFIEANGNVYVSTTTGIYAFRASNGQQLWRAFQSQGQSEEIYALISG